MSIQSSERGVSLRQLLGCGGERIDWRLPAAFAVALFLANVPEIIRTFGTGRSFPKELRLWFGAVYLIGPILLAAVAVLAFRFVRSVWAACAAGAAAYAVFMVPVRLAFQPGFQPIQLLYSWLWVFLFLGGLVLALRWIRSIPLALAAGATVPAWFYSLLSMAITTLGHPGIHWSVGGELLNAGMTLVSYVIFALVFWGAIRLLAIPVVPVAPSVAAGAESVGDEAWLRKALVFQGLSRQLRASGIGSLLFGAIAIVLGATTMGQVSINGVLIVLGLLLIAEGVWIMAAPSAAGIAVDGLAVTLIGLWNIGISLSAIGRSAGNSLSGRFLVFGIFQIVWGIGRVSQYRRYAELRGFRLDPESRSRLDREIEAIQGATGRRDVVAFKNGADEGRFRLLGGSAALFLRGKFVEILSRGDVHCGPVQASAGDSLKLTLRLKKRGLSTTLTPEAHQRLQEWIGATIGAPVTTPRP
jgi:hypothetical protein